MRISRLVVEELAQWEAQFNQLDDERCLEDGHEQTLPEVYESTSDQYDQRPLWVV
jgi:hypothetical protein